MTSSRTSLAVLAAAFLAASAPAWSDDTGGATAPPRTLGEKMPQSEQAAPPATVPAPEAPATPDRSGERPPEIDTSDLKSDVPEPPAGRAPAAAPPTAPSEPPPPAVQVETLGTVEGPAAGLLDSGNGGMDQNIWTGSSRADIETLLPHIPLAAPDSAVRALSRRLILTKADAPSGTMKRSIAAIRVEKLLEAGLTDEAAALAMQASAKEDPDFPRVQADAILTAGHAGDACGNATSARLEEDGQFWLELRAYCAAQAGDTASADLTRGVLDAKGLSDPAFNILLEDVQTKTKKPPGAIAKPSAMHLFLLRKAGVSIGTDVAKHLGAAANVFVMRNPHETPAARLAAAERIVKTGAATTAELISVLDAQPVTPGAPANAAKLPFLAAQGALRRAALLESRPAVKAELVHEALVLGDKAAMFEISARLQADVVEKLDPAPVPENLRPLIGWALLLAGKPDAAARWIGEGDTARAVLALVSGKDGAPSDLSSIAVRVAGSDKAADPGRAFDALVLGIYNVLALPAPTDAKQVAASVEGRHWPGRRPANEAMQTILKAASAPDRKGEAVLRILEAVGADGPRDLAPDITIEFLRALEDMGLKDAAHALAIHAVLLYRPGTP